jgi:hypothetical protein
MGNFFTDVITPDPRFTTTSIVNDLELLEPTTRAAVQAIIADAQAQGIHLIAFETYRSQQRQQFLHDTGKSQLRTVGVHHYGLACDLVKVVNGKPTWDGDYSFLGVLAKAHGLIWGGDWGDPTVHHSFIDSDHVQRVSVAEQTQLFAGTFYPEAAPLPDEAASTTTAV